MYCRKVQTLSYPRVARIIDDPQPLPDPASTTEEDNLLFADEPWVIAPIRADYGFNIKLGAGAMVNCGSMFVDTCPVYIGARTLCGPNCSFYSGTHPLDPAVRMGMAGPELGKPIVIGEDCWLGGGTFNASSVHTSSYYATKGVIVLPGITIGRGCSVGAGSVVTKGE